MFICFNNYLSCFNWHLTVVKEINFLVNSCHTTLFNLRRRSDKYPVSPNDSDTIAKLHIHQRPRISRNAVTKKAKSALSAGKLTFTAFRIIYGKISVYLEKCKRSKALLGRIIETNRNGPFCAEKRALLPWHCTGLQLHSDYELLSHPP